MPLHRLATLIILAALPGLGVADSPPLRIATWNLGWHIASEEVPAWIARCDRFFVRNPDTKVWMAAQEGDAGARRGWEITESRATVEGVDLAVMPPCNVYRTAGFKGVAVTPAAYAHRTRQIQQLLSRDVRADVIAFQEVSGTRAVIEALGAQASDFHVCSFDGRYKVQRLAFAWRKRFGPAEEACRDLAALSLPDRSPQDQVRPGFIVTLRLNGKTVRFLNVHLKSGCVSPLGRSARRLDDEAQDACATLQQQVRPLEAAVEQLGVGVDHFVVLGDFNRNLAHELHEVAGAEARRRSGQTDLTTPLQPGDRTRNLLREINDASPAHSGATLLMTRCTGSAELAAACDAVKTAVPTPEQQSLLASREGLGCRNPVGLDFVLVSNTLAPAVVSATKVAIGPFGGSRLPSATRADPLLAVSDHCPIVVEVGVR